jgi:uridylate kinase
VLRAVEIEAEVVIKGTRVDGVYDKDPEKHDDAVRFDRLTYREVLDKDLRVMDMTAITMAQENHKPIYVFDMNVPGNLKRLLMGEPVATIVSE